MNNLFTQSRFKITALAGAVALSAVLAGCGGDDPAPAAVVEAAAVASPDLQNSDDWQQIPADGYVLQLAAHRSLANAETALAVFDAPGAEIVKTRGSKGDLYVILAGNYPDRAAAKAAAEAFRERNEGADYWIRDAADFLGAL